MSDVLILIAILIALSNSALMLATNAISYDSLLDKHVTLKACLVITLFALLIILPWQVGAVARFETSVLPWEVWQQESSGHGYYSGIVAVLINLTFLLWAFLIPGHLYASSVSKKTKRRPVYPYVVNILIGMILSIPRNPIYSSFGMLFGAT